ncbi:hypothetical protein BS47DRAFT_1291884, partial [Hydnum rufescens UP504]
GYHLEPSIYLSEAARGFALGEYILVRIPTPIQIGGNTETRTAAESGLLFTSNAKSAQHFGFIRSVVPLPDGSIQLEVYPQISLTRRGGPLAGYSQIDDSSPEILISLPPLSHSHPTPEHFGDSLVIGGWSNDRDAWLSVVPTKFILPWTRPFKRMIPPVSMSSFEMRRIEHYRNTRPTLPLKMDQAIDDVRRNVSPRQADGGQMTSATVSEPTVVSRPGNRAQKRAALEAELWQFVRNLSSDEILTLESVDEDAEGGDDCTTRNELILLARGHPS